MMIPDGSCWPPAPLAGRQGLRSRMLSSGLRGQPRAENAGESRVVRRIVVVTVRPRMVTGCRMDGSRRSCCRPQESRSTPRTAICRWATSVPSGDVDVPQCQYCCRQLNPPGVLFKTLPSQVTGKAAALPRFGPSNDAAQADAHNQPEVPTRSRLQVMTQKPRCCSPQGAEPHRGPVTLVNPVRIGNSMSKTCRIVSDRCSETGSGRAARMLADTTRRRGKNPGSDFPVNWPHRPKSRSSVRSEPVLPGKPSPAVGNACG